MYEKLSPNRSVAGLSECKVFNSQCFPALIYTNFSVYGNLFYPKEGQINLTLIYFLSIPLADHDTQVTSIYIYVLTS